MTVRKSTRRRLLAATAGLGLTGLAGCAGLVQVPEDPEPDPTVTQEVTFEIPQYVESDGTPIYSDNGLRFIDYSNIAHGIGIASTAMRQSQWGHDNYDADMYYETMPETAVTWLDILENNLMEAFSRELDGMIWPYLEEHEDGWVREGDSTLGEEYQYASYVYHVHHRSGRYGEHTWEDTSLFRELTFTSPPYQAAVGQHILDERRDGGQIFHEVDGSNVDNESMAYGLAGANTQWYAWVRHSKPDGHDDMTRVDDDTLIDFVGYNTDALGEVAYDIKQELDQHWDESAGTYAIDGTTYPIDAAGAMIRGGKVLYDALHEFYGDETEAMDQFEKTTRMFDEIYESDIVEPHGVPAEIEFTSNGVQAASDTVDVQRQWQFLGHFTNGYSLSRDRFTDLVDDNRSDIFDAIGEIADELLLGAMDHQLGDNDILVSELDYNTGSITDDRHEAAAVGIFTAVAVEAYGAGEAFVSPGDWGEVDLEIESQSLSLYDMVVDHREFIEDNFLIEA